MTQIKKLDALKKNKTYRALPGSTDQEKIQLMLNYAAKDEAGRKTFADKKFGKELSENSKRTVDLEDKALKKLINHEGNVGEGNIIWADFLKDLANIESNTETLTFNLPEGLKDYAPSIHTAFTSDVKETFSQRYGLTGAVHGVLVGLVVGGIATAVMQSANLLLPAMVGFSPIAVTTTLVALGSMLFCAAVGGWIGHQSKWYTDKLKLAPTWTSAKDFADSVQSSPIVVDYGMNETKNTATVTLTPKVAG
jgi:hypothetical protein